MPPEKITIGNGSVSVNQAGGYQTILAYPTCVKIFSNSTGNCMLVGGCVNAAKFLEAGTCLVSKYAQTCALGTIAPYNIWTGSTASYASVTPKLNTTLYLVTS